MNDLCNLHNLPRLRKFRETLSAWLQDSKSSSTKSHNPTITLGLVVPTLRGYALLRVKVQAWLWAFNFLCSAALNCKVKEGHRLQVVTLLHTFT